MQIALIQSLVTTYLSPCSGRAQASPGANRWRRSDRPFSPADGRATIAVLTGGYLGHSGPLPVHLARPSKSSLSALSPR